MSRDHPDDLFAEALLQMGAVTFEQLEAARALQTGKNPAVPLAEILIQQSVITSLMRENVEKKLHAQRAGGIRKLGPYVLRKKLGEGGMGMVYLAEDTQLKRSCAVKVLSREYGANREFISRFRREAMAAGKLNHPHIVLAYTIGEELGYHYYAMEFCEGQPLDRVLNVMGALPWRLATEVVRQVAQGLQHAHENGIIHRDIKPSNIFICRPVGMSTPDDNASPFPEGFQAKILDLGLSKSIGVGAESSFLTHTGVTMGTPHYISPEQANGERDIDGRTDIYSLGATFYHLITGQTPFAGSSAAAVILKHLREPVRDPKDLTPDLPAGMSMVIQRMLAKASGDRYATCADVVQELEGILAGQRPKPVATALSGQAASALPDANNPAATIMLEETAPATRQRLRPLAVVAGLLIVLLLSAAWLAFRRPAPQVPEVKQVASNPPISAVQEKEVRSGAPVSETQQRLDEEARQAAEAARLAREAEQGAKLSALEEQLLRERRKAEEASRQLAEAQRQMEEAQRPPAPEDHPLEPPVQDHPPTDALHRNGEENEPAPPGEPPGNVPPLEAHRPETEILGDLERWVQDVLQEDQPSEPVALPELVWVDDVNGLKRLHQQLARKVFDAEEAQQRAVDNETAARNRVGILQRRLTAPERPFVPEPRPQPGQPGRPPGRPQPPLLPPPDDRTRWERDADRQQLDQLHEQARNAREETERVRAALRALSGAKQTVAQRLRSLGVEDLSATDSTPRKEIPYKIYVLRDGRELKVYMAMKMGEQVAIKGEDGEMQTLNASDIKEIRDREGTPAP